MEYVRLTRLPAWLRSGKRPLLAAVLALISGAVIWACSAPGIHTRFNHWLLTPTGQGALTWMPFLWQGAADSSGAVRREAMFVPVRLGGIPRRLHLQFDLGSDYTMLYENTARSIFSYYPSGRYRISAVRGPFGNTEALELPHCSLQLDGITAYNPHLYVRGGFGEPVSQAAVNDPDMVIPVGTLGADLFQGKTLLIDYPRQRFAVCDSVPPEYNTGLIDMELDKDGRVILPMRVNGTTFRVSFDNGSSLYQLITVPSKADRFAPGPVIDTTFINAWNEQILLTSRRMQDSIELGGRRFGNIIVHVNHGGHGTNRETDATTGNALVWDRMLILDFRRKKFGLR